MQERVQQPPTSFLACVCSLSASAKNKFLGWQAVLRQQAERCLVTSAGWLFLKALNGAARGLEACLAACLIHVSVHGLREDGTCRGLSGRPSVIVTHCLHSGWYMVLGHHHHHHHQHHPQQERKKVLNHAIYELRRSLPFQHSSLQSALQKICKKMGLEG